MAEVYKCYPPSIFLCCVLGCFNPDHIPPEPSPTPLPKRVPMKTNKEKRKRADNRTKLPPRIYFNTALCDPFFPKLSSFSPFTYWPCQLGGLRCFIKRLQKLEVKLSLGAVYSFSLDDGVCSGLKLIEKWFHFLTKISFF